MGFVISMYIYIWAHNHTLVANPMPYKEHQKNYQHLEMIFASHLWPFMVILDDCVFFLGLLSLLHDVFMFDLIPLTL